MEKFNNKYRIASHRKSNWNYSNDGFYFLTLVTQNRVCNLGTIKNHEMELSEFGKIVENEWFKSFKIRNELFFHEFIIMPNHLHTIVEIDADFHKNDHNNLIFNSHVETHGRASLKITNNSEKTFENDDSNIQTHGRASLPFNQNNWNLLQIKPNQPIRLPKSISSFIAGFKSAINSKIDDYIDLNHLNIPKFNRHNHFFQSNYHDHLIRNHDEFLRIQNYIIENPKNWGKERWN